MIRILRKHKFNFKILIVSCFLIAIAVACLIIAKPTTTSLSLAEHKSTISVSQPLHSHMEPSAPQANAQTVAPSQTPASISTSKPTAAVPAPTTKAPATVSRTNTSASVSSKTNNSQPAVSTLPQLTGIVLHETSTLQPGSYWWEPIGNAPVNGYIFIWTNGCNYPVAGKCINDNANQIIQYGQRVMINGGGDYRIPVTLDTNAPLSVIVCQNVNNQCGIISNVIEIPFGPGVSDPNPIS